MSDYPIPMFIIGSGRCGTRTMFKMLSGVPDLEIYHEFVCTHVQKLACLYYMEVINKNEVKAELHGLHGAGIAYSDARIWIDASNKLSWLIEPLMEMYPNARFLALVRDGRKVASSFFYKLAPEMYDDRSTRILTNWLADSENLPPPPPEKKYWWNIPRPGQPFYEEFRDFDQFQRVCYHWSEVNRVILQDLERYVPLNQKIIIKLEDLTTNLEVLHQVLDFIGIEFDFDYVEFLKTPQNVFFPIDFQLTDSQLAQFHDIAWPMMKTLDYENENAYTVRY